MKKITERNIGGLTEEHFTALNAVVLWHRTLKNMTYRLKDPKYSRFIANAHIISFNNTLTNPNDENDVKKIIHDFYDYFYTNQHIADFNYQNFDLFTNDYVLLKKVLTNSNSNEIDMLYVVTSYVFKLLVSLREPLQLPVFERKKHDKYIVKYFTRYYGKGKSYNGFSEGY